MGSRSFKRTTVAAALATTVLCAWPATGLGAQPAPERAAIFTWSMPERFGASEDAEHRVVETQPDEVRQGPWTVDVEVTGRACAKGARYRWRVGRRRATPVRVDLCRFRFRFPIERAYRVHLDARVAGLHLEATRKIPVRDWLIVSIGDSVASGEAVPDVSDLFHATWQSVRCHRSARAGSALAARQIEEDDSHSSVTFVHLACSGAGVRTGLLRPYAGAEPPPDEPPLEPQVDTLNRIAARRQVDAVLVNIGANDIHFGDVVRFCAVAPTGNCFRRVLPEDFGGDGRSTAGEAVEQGLRHLKRLYRRLAGRISPRIPHSKVFIVDYFDPTHDSHGQICDGILAGVGSRELALAHARMLVPLNRLIAASASSNGWSEVAGVAQLFREHGYCAGDQAWVKTLPKSLTELGGTLRGRLLGTLHPNRNGHIATATLISAALEKAFFPDRPFPPHPLPEPEESSSPPWALIAGVALLLYWPFLTLLVLAVSASWIAIGWGLWVFHENGAPIVIGLALGVAILFNREQFSRGAMPFKELIRTFRPLFLPLLVVVAVGTVKFPVVTQVLISATVLVLIWRLIVDPEMPPRGDRAALLGQGVIALALGSVAVFGATLLGLDSRYLETVGDVPARLVLVAVTLWTAALFLRLFSHATTTLRSVLAFDIGLGIVFFAMTFGVLPGRPGLHDVWPLLAGIFGGTALLLLAVDSVKRLADDSSGEFQMLQRSRPSRLGFSTAMAAALALLVSTGVGLVLAGNRGKALNPPDNASAATLMPTLAKVATGAKLAESAKHSDLALAEAFSPVLTFTKKERWAPVRVNGYLRNAELIGPRPANSTSLSDLPTSCHAFGQSRCYYLTIHCDDGHRRCAHATHHVAGHLYREGATYVRVVHKDALKNSDPPEAFAGDNPFSRELATLVQYWYFYYYDEWETPVFAGTLTQRHEGDWEAVTIGFAKHRRPLFVADSAHCAGSWKRWPEIEVSTAPGIPGPHIHPLVAVAEGSHANYPEADQSRSPDWAHCQHAPEGVASALSFASNIRDKTEYGWLWYPPPGGWIEVDSETRPMDFPGAWGADENMFLYNFESNRLAEGDAPLTPSLQPLWREPVRVIFCTRFTPHKCHTGA